ncbi:MAG: 5-formyltetrahydrofolate cyclo-ligase [Reyranellaceae bacterium]
MTDELSDAKQALRRSMATRRDAIDWHERQRAAAVVASLLPAQVPMARDAVVGGYFPHRSEFDVQPLLRVLAETGCALALPKMDGAKAPLTFRHYEQGDTLVLNRFGIPEPGPAAPVVTPSHLLVPLLAFDELGYRLGYGGGYYDRTLAAMRGAGHAVFAIGIAYDFQRLPYVPRQPNDEPLELIATECGLYGPQAGERR